MFVKLWLKSGSTTGKKFIAKLSLNGNNKKSKVSEYGEKNAFVLYISLLQSLEFSILFILFKKNYENKKRKMAF